MPHYIYAAIFFTLSSFSSITAALWSTGGIYSVDIFWYIILSIGTSLFVHRKAGAFVSFGALLSLTLYYCIEINDIRDFKSLRLSHAPSEDYINLMIIFSFYTLLHYLYMNSDKLRLKKEEDTEQKASELEKSNQLVMEQVNEVISIQDNQGVIEFISPYVRELLGYKPHELVGQKFDVLNLSLNVNKSNSYWQGEVKTKFNESRWVEIETKLTTQNKERGERYLSIMRDISGKIEADLKLRELRKELAQDFHDEMGNKLASISMNASLLRDENDFSSKDEGALNHIYRKSSELYSVSRDFIWSIDSDNSNLEKIFVYITDFGNDLFENNKVDFESSFEINADHRFEFDVRHSRHIILLLKEAITNAFKYSKGTKVNFRIGLEDEKVVFSVEDDGIGFDLNDPQLRVNGLQNIQSRANRMFSVLSIQSKIGKGTKIILIMGGAKSHSE